MYGLTWCHFFNSKIVDQRVWGSDRIDGESVGGVSLVMLGSEKIAIIGLCSRLDYTTIDT